MKEIYIVKRLAEHYKSLGYLAKPFFILNPIITGHEVTCLSQPHIDLLLSPLKGYIPKHIEGHEVKLFKIRSGYPDQSYYVGLDEALALLMLGVDYAVLEAIIWNPVAPENYLDYFKPLVSLIEHLSLPIGFVLRGAFRVQRSLMFTEPVIKIEPKPNPLLKLESIRLCNESLKSMLHPSI